MNRMSEYSVQAKILNLIIPLLNGAWTWQHPYNSKEACPLKIEVVHEFICKYINFQPLAALWLSQPSEA